MHYLLVARDDRFWLVGPFDSEGNAAAWGSDPANNPSDDPRWQTIFLKDASAPVEIIPPLQPMPTR
jgi:hypothetical protein